MAIGERIRFLRNLHGATQKWLGIKLGYSEKTAETRVGQYEIGVRTPKDDMIKDIAKIFGVSPQVIKLPDIDNYDALLHTLFAIEDIYGLTINMLDDEFCLTLNRDNPSYFPTYNMFRIWNKIVRKNRNVEIAKKNFIYDYTENTITNNIGIVI